MPRNAKKLTEKSIEAIREVNKLSCQNNLHNLNK